MDSNSLKKITFDDLYSKASEYLHIQKNLDLIKKAYFYAKEKHEGQFRKSGDPYIQHPLEVAYYLATLHSSPETVCAGLLHDVLEDTAVTKEEMEALATKLPNVLKFTDGHEIIKTICVPNKLVNIVIK